MAVAATADVDVATAARSGIQGLFWYTLIPDSVNTDCISSWLANAGVRFAGVG